MPQKRPVKRHPVTQPTDPSYRLIPLTQGQNAIVDAADFEWLSQWNWYADFHKRRSCFYAKRHGIYMHKKIFGHLDGLNVDHKDRNTLNNRRCNLRANTHIQNSQNIGPKKHNTSGFKGVGLDRRPLKKRWYAEIRTGNRRVWFQRFYSSEDAARAYDQAAKIYHGEFAYLNFPNE